ncbi:FecR family protein [Nubsella zeaxanthinifaciens]|uniref:FecR family protein n=1 Tax=Nubsella zeaxanthinifaciens TaxID=392412 RepID=UPI0013003089|nr:FecR domain-containing protein [Nubsella zeaxanthinifaciens]
MSEQFKTKLLFNKYLSNSCTAKEMDELFELLKTDSNIQIIEDDLEKLWKNTELLPQSSSNEVLYQQLKRKIETANKPYSFVKKSNGKYKWIAAACLLIGVFSYLTLKNLAKVNTVSPAIIAQKSSSEVKRILLPDGSTVWLNKNAHLKYPSSFTTNAREVYLSGEAYFDIKHDSNKPFLVHTGNLVTRVLGTAFNVKAKQNTPIIEVTVTRGKVAVSDLQKTLAVLTPNQQISYNKQLNAYKKEQVNANLNTLWKEDDLVLNNVTLAEAIKKIETRYAAKIQTNDAKIMDYEFTAYFLNTSDLEQVIKVIADLNHLSYKVDSSGTYILSKEQLK